MGGLTIIKQNGKVAYKTTVVETALRVNYIAEQVKQRKVNKPMKETMHKVKVDVPMNFEQALKSPEWVAAMESEIASFATHEVYEPFTPLKHIASEVVRLTSFWMFNRKSNGMCKARLVTMNPKTIGHKDSEASSPVAASEYLWSMFVRLTHSTELKFSTYDISTAFLNTPIKGKTYVCSVPKGFKSNCPGIQSLKLKKYVYGLNAAPLYFHLWLTDLIRKRYVVAKHDNCLYTDFNKSLFALLHVDDILLLAKANEEFEQLLRTKFELKIDHHPTQYLGFDFQQNEKTVGLSLHTYIEKMVRTLNQNLETIKPTGKPRIGLHVIR